MPKEYDYFIRSLKEGEELVELVRRYWLVRVWQILLGLFFLVMPFFLLYLLVQRGRWGLAGFGVSVGIGVIILARVGYQWSRSAFIITNLRVIDVDQRGFFHKSVAEASYEKIQDVIATIRGIAATLLHYGTVQIQTASSGTALELDHVKDPEGIKDIISEWQGRAGSATEDDEEFDADEARLMLKRLRAKVGEEEMKRLVEE